jgi:hypothetical protein
MEYQAIRSLDKYPRNREGFEPITPPHERCKILTAAGTAAEALSMSEHEDFCYVDLSAHKIICLATDSYMSVYYRPCSGLYTRKQDDLFEEMVVKLQMEWRRHLPCKQQLQRSVPPSASDSNYETLSYTDGIHSLTTLTNQAAIHPVPVPLILHYPCGDLENKINHR